MKLPKVKLLLGN